MKKKYEKRLFFLCNNNKREDNQRIRKNIREEKCETSRVLIFRGILTIVEYCHGFF